MEGLTGSREDIYVKAPMEEAMVGDIKVIDTGDFIINSNSPGASGYFPGREPIDMIHEVPPIPVKGKSIWCDGGIEGAELSFG